MAKGNPGEQIRFWTQGQANLPHALERIRATDTLRPKAGARCGNSACRDLCGGWPARAIPTANIDDRYLSWMSLFIQRPTLCRAFSPEIVGESVFPALRAGLVCCRAFGAPEGSWTALTCSASNVYPYLSSRVSEPANLRPDNQRVLATLPEVSRRCGVRPFLDVRGRKRLRLHLFASLVSPRYFWVPQISHAFWRCRK